MKYSNIPSAYSIVHHCKSNGIKNIVISPGSRNAPLIIGFSEDSFFNCFSIVDERCAAFFALGIAQQINEPVVVICTSGSALLNYYPAIAEAFYSAIPLVVISADRPDYKLDIGDGQTINQKNVFQSHIGYSANLKQDVTHATDTIKHFVTNVNLEEGSIKEKQSVIQAHNDSELHKALCFASTEGLPVHINVPFEEPLYAKIAQAPAVPFGMEVDEEKDPVKIDINDFSAIWNASKKKIVLVGVNPPNTTEQQFLDELAEDKSVLVFTETTSNIHHPNFFSSIDSIIVPIEKGEDTEALSKALQPDILLTFGGLIVSKKIKSFLRKYKPKHHWHVDAKKARDTFFCLTHHFKVSPNEFFPDFLNALEEQESHYYPFWSPIREAYIQKREEYLKEISFSDMAAFNLVLKAIPDNYQLQLANSSTIRYTQLFNLNPSLKVFCNRGTSGIDGSTSTAIGASIYSEEPTLFITGDLSFFYDSNGLWNKYIKSDFRIILINNSGGGIFRILPGMGATYNFESYFETSHDYDAEQICKMYGFEYLVAEDQPKLKNILYNFYEKSNAPKLLEIKTPRLLNNKILLSYFDFIS